MHTETVIAFLTEAFNLEEQTRFSRLSRIPDTRVWKFLEYYRALGQEEAQLLKRCFAKRAVGFFNPQPLTKLATDSEMLAHKRCLDHLACMGDYRFMSLKLLKMAVGYCRCEPAVKT